MRIELVSASAAKQEKNEMRDSIEIDTIFLNFSHYWDGFVEIEMTGTFKMATILIDWLWSERRMPEDSDKQEVLWASKSKTENRRKLEEESWKLVNLMFIQNMTWTWVQIETKWEKSLDMIGRDIVKDIYRESTSREFFAYFINLIWIRTLSFPFKECSLF